MPTLATLFAAYLADKRLDHAPITQYQQRLFFAAVVTQFGDLRLDAVTPEFVRTWKMVLSTVYARSTAYRYMHFLSAALHYAVACGWLEAHPMARIKKPSPGQGRMRFLRDDERLRLLTACRESPQPLLYPLVVVALATGGRKQEVLGLRWTEVDPHHGVLRFLKTKTHLDRSVPVRGEGLTVLRELSEQRQGDTPWVFVRTDGRPLRTMEQAWRTARRRAQLSDFRFHDLRHTYASNLAATGATLLEIAELLGHKRIQQSMRCAHLLPSHMTSVVERMTQRYGDAEVAPRAPGGTSG